jgi:hypothetical protein
MRSNDKAVVTFHPVSNLRAGFHVAVTRNVSDPDAKNHAAKVKMLMADELQNWKEQNPTEKDKDFPKGIFKPVTDCSNFDAVDDDDDDDD